MGWDPTRTVKAVATGGLSEVGGLLGGLSGPKQLNTSSSSLPNEYVLPYYKKMLEMGQNLATDPNASAASLNPLQAQGLQGIQNAVNNPQGLLAMGTQGMQDTLSGKYLDPSTNPALQGMANNILGQVRGSLGSTFSGNNFGSSAHEQMFNRQATQGLANLYGQNYAQERANQMAAMGQAPAYSMAGANALLGAGNAQQQIGQNQLGLLQNVVGTGLSGGLNTTGVQDNPNYQTPLQSLLGLGSTLGGAYLMGGGLKGGAASGGTTLMGGGSGM